MRAHIHNAQAFLAEYGDVFARRRLGVTGIGHLQARFLGTGKVVLARYHHFVNPFAQVAQVKRLVCRGADFGLTHGQKAVAQGVDADVAVAKLLRGTQGKFLGAAAAWDDPNAKLHQSDVALGVRHHFVYVEADFTATTQGKSVRCCHHRYTAVAQTHGGILEGADCKVQLVVFLFHREHENQAHVGTGRKVLAFVADDHSAVIGFG